MRHQYGISALVSQTSFRGETSGGVMKWRLFSLATLDHACRPRSAISRDTILPYFDETGIIVIACRRG